MHFYRTLTAFLCALALSSFAQIPRLPMQDSKQATVPPIPAPSVNPAGPAALTPQDVTAFLDGFLPLQLQRDDVAGATISITQNGVPLVLKGYGYADWKKKTPVDPVTTTFRPGSISKLFVYVAMMQMVEQGKLSLDTDVNQYLDFKVFPGPRGVGDMPITLRHLATHTAGFEEVLHDFGSDQSGKLPYSIRDVLMRNQPHRFAAPGKVLAYSNYGITMIGYLVQRASGEPFADYVQRHIFVPLGMTHSTFVQPLPAGFSRSLGYNSTSKPDLGFEGVTDAPAGGLSSTAADMALFGEMLLRHGTLKGQQILQPTSVDTLFTPQFRPAPGIAPWCLGLYTEQRNGLSFTGHGGDLIGFHSQFWVEPIHQLTFFISYNSAKSQGDAREELFRAFVDRYLPGAPMLHPAYLKLTTKELAPYTGDYATSRRSDSTKFRLLNMGSREVSANKDGNLTISTAKDFRQQPIQYHPIGNDSFYAEESQSILHFERDSHGRISGYASPGHSDRVPVWLGSKVFPVLLLAAAVTVFLVCLAPLVRAYRRLFHRRRASVTPQPGTRWMTFSLQLACWMIVLVMVQLAALLLPVTELKSFYQIGHLDRGFMVQNVLVVMALLAIAPGVLSGVRTLREPLKQITKVKFACVTLACVYFAWFAFFFHMIGSAHRY